MKYIRHSHEYIKKQFELKGCKLLNTYIKDKSELDYICHCGNRSKTNWHNFSRNGGCRKCLGNRRKYLLEDIKEYFKKYDCELLEDEYIGCNQYLKYKCKNGHISEQQFVCFKRTNTCKKCTLEEMIKRRLIGYENVKKQIENTNEYELLTIKNDYKDTRTYLKIHCKKCEKIFSNTIIQFNINNGCLHKKKLKGENHPFWIEDSENSTKNCRYIKKEFEQWLISKNIKFISQLK